MWLGFKPLWVSFFLIVIAFTSYAQKSNGLVYNLKQNWVQYDENVNGFLPAIINESTNAISFKLNGRQFRNHNLYIYNSGKASLFYGNVLLTPLSVGGHNFDLDSLVNYLKTETPLLTIYGSNLKSSTQTLIVDKSYSSVSNLEPKEHFRSSPFTTYYIFALSLLFVGLILIKTKSIDLFAQYNSIQRALNPKTIDEVIYKGRFFTNPSIAMILWMSFSSAFVLNFLINKLNINFVIFANFDSGTVSFFIINWVTLSIGFLVLFVIRYWLVYLMSLIFDMLSTKSIHFASHLRLTYLLLLVLLVLITLDYFSIMPFSKTYIIGILFGSLLIIIILIGFRLTFANKHAFVYKFLYLCGTEIFLYVFVYKLVVG